MTAPRTRDAATQCELMSVTPTLSSSRMHEDDVDITDTEEEDDEESDSDSVLDDKTKDADYDPESDLPHHPELVSDL